MLALLGILLVFTAVLGGFLLERGNPWVLMQPAELVIIGGASLGTVLIANPLGTIIKMAKGAIGVFLRTRASHDSGSGLDGIVGSGDLVGHWPASGSPWGVFCPGLLPLLR